MKHCLSLNIYGELFKPTLPIVIGTRGDSAGSVIVEMKSNLIAQMRTRIKLEIAV